MTLTRKTDATYAAEIKEILDAYVDKANEMAIKSMYINFQMTNGADGKPIVLQSFEVLKKIALPEVLTESNPA